MSRINKNKMWMGNPVLRQQSFSFKTTQTPAIIDTIEGAEYVSYIKSGKTIIDSVSGDINVSNDVETNVIVYGNNISTIYADACDISEIDISMLDNLSDIQISNNLFKQIVLPKINKFKIIDLSTNKIESLDASNINPETITSLRIGTDPFLSDETAALAFANSLPTVTTSPTLIMYSSDTQATAVQSIAEGKGWKVTIS